MLKLNNITSEGVRSDEPIEVRLKDNDSGAPTGCVFTFRPGTNKEWEKAQNRHVRFVKNEMTKAMEREPNLDAALNAFVTEKLIGWTGLEARDGAIPFRPELIPAVLGALVNGYKWQLVRGIIGNELIDDQPAEVQAASF